MLPSKATATYRGITFTVEWRDATDDYHPAWWVTLDTASFPASPDRNADIIDEVCARYISQPPPSNMSEIWGGYKCSDCGAEGVRLWREYQTFLDRQKLRCRTCSEKHEEKELRGDQIGWLIPAVPSPDGKTFWGYMSIPMSASKWWRSLPESL